MDAEERIKVVTASGEVELSRATYAELAKRVERGPARLAASLQPGASSELDEQSKRCILDELTFWLDNPSPDGFPDDARALFRALAEELTPR